MEAMNLWPHEGINLCNTCKTEENRKQPPAPASVRTQVLWWAVGLTITVFYGVILIQESSVSSTIERSLTASDARRICTEGFDYSRGNLSVWEMGVTPWDSHTTKAFRVASIYERDGRTYGFGCTVYKDGKAEINYNE
ncbi:MAG TPA: hypothetical protein VLF09_07865 [Cellvibrio sp.]|nr:hypothetical protein [Cellvibrio sp.]